METRPAPDAVQGPGTGIRALDVERELVEFLRVRNQDQPFTMTPEQWLERDARIGPDLYRRTLVRPQGNGIVAVGTVADHPLLENGVWVNVTVDRARRGEGYGREMAAALRPLLAERRPSTLEVRMRDDDERSREWAERRGFRVADRVVHHRLDLAGFDAGPHMAGIERAEAGGVRFRTVTDPAAVYDLYAELARDAPGQLDVPDRAFFEQHFSAARGDAFVVASLGSRPVGLATLETTADGGSWNTFVSVRSGQRLDGVIESLQVLVAREAAARGRRWLGTTHGVVDGSFGAGLGFRRVLGILWLRRPFAAAV